MTRRTSRQGHPLPKAKRRPLRGGACFSGTTGCSGAGVTSISRCRFKSDTPHHLLHVTDSGRVAQKPVTRQGLHCAPHQKPPAPNQQAD